MGRLKTLSEKKNKLVEMKAFNRHLRKFVHEQDVERVMREQSVSRDRAITILAIDIVDRFLRKEGP